MKQIINLMLLLALICVPGAARADLTPNNHREYSFCENGIYYVYAGAYGNSLQVVDADATYALQIPQMTASGEIVDCVQERAFENRTDLGQVHIGAVRGCQSRAFDSCTNLEGVRSRCWSMMGDSIFANCTSLTYVEMPNIIQTIPGMFLNCTSLMSIELPGVTHADDEDYDENGQLKSPAFKGCSNLKLIILPKVTDFSLNLTGVPVRQITLGNNALENLTIGTPGHFPGTLETIGLYAENISVNNYAFSEASNLKEIWVHDIESWLNADMVIYDSNGYPYYLGPGNFDMDPMKLYTSEGPVVNLTIPAGQSVRPNAFMNISLEKVTIEGGEEPVDIGDFAFWYSGIRELNLGEGVRSVGSSALSHNNLTNLKFPESVDSYGQNSLTYNPFEELVLSPNAKLITHDFLANHRLKHFIVPEGVTEMESDVLVVGYPYTLEFISLPSTLVSMNGNHYNYNPEFGNGKHTFMFSLKSIPVYCWADVPPSAKYEDFTGVTVHVKASAVDSYRQNPDWAKANLIGDLDNEHTVTVTGNSLVIEVPVNDIDNDVRIATYEVTVNRLDGDGNVLESNVYNFDNRGQLLDGAANAVSRSGLTLTIPGIDPDGRYSYIIKGKAADTSVVYQGEGEVGAPGAGVEGIEADTSAPLEYFNLQGISLGTDFDALPQGIYLTREGKVMKTY